MEHRKDTCKVRVGVEESFHYDKLIAYRKTAYVAT